MVPFEGLHEGSVADCSVWSRIPARRHGAVAAGELHHEAARADAAPGQALTEFAVLYAGVILPLTFMTIFVAEMLWIWHSVADFTRDGARYAATHCWMSDWQQCPGVHDRPTCRP